MARGGDERNGGEERRGSRRASWSTGRSWALNPGRWEPGGWGAAGRGGPDPGAQGRPLVVADWRMDQGRGQRAGHWARELWGGWQGFWRQSPGICRWEGGDILLESRVRPGRHRHVAELRARTLEGSPGTCGCSSLAGWEGGGGLLTQAGSGMGPVVVTPQGRPRQGWR